MGLDLSFTIKIIIIAIIAFLVITAWDEVLDRTIFKWFGLDREELSSWIVVAIIATILLFVILIVFNIEAHDVLGISETVDTQLTGKVEKLKRGIVIHTTSK